MASFTTAQDVADALNRSYNAEEQASVERFIPWAERYLLRAAGWAFYTTADRTSDDSLNWIVATALIVDRYLLTETPEVKAAMASPYRSVTIGRTRLDFKDAAKTMDVDGDPDIQGIVAFYRANQGMGTHAVVAQGPTRNKQPEYDPDILAGSTEGDASRFVPWEWLAE